MFKTFKLFDRYACSIGFAFEKTTAVFVWRVRAREGLKPFIRFEHFKRFEQLEQCSHN